MEIKRKVVMPDSTVWELNGDIEELGLIPTFLNANDPKSAKEQFNTNYSHGGGWRAFEGFRVDEDMSIQYPGDPKYHPIAKCRFRNENIYVYPYAWVLVMQDDGTHEMSRMD